MHYRKLTTTHTVQTHKLTTCIQGARSRKARGIGFRTFRFEGILCLMLSHTDFCWRDQTICCIYACTMSLQHSNNCISTDVNHWKKPDTATIQNICLELLNASVVRQSWNVSQALLAYSWPVNAELG